MAADKGGIYQRGGFWLDLARGAGGKPASANWYICWYDAAVGRQRRKTTGTSDVRSACDALDAHYLASHRPTAVEQAAYSVPEAMTDYYVEHGQQMASAEAIRARLKLMSRFMDVEADAGRLIDPFLPEHLDDRFLDRFRQWAAADPIVARKKDARGDWIDGEKRARSAATIEESVIQLKAALNHAFAQRRTRYVPPLKHKTRDAVTVPRSYRLSIDGLAELLDFTMRGAGAYGGHAARLLPLRRYLIAGICTLARPDAILDMSVDPKREQWLRDDRLFALNHAGRLQTKKVRPTVPVVDLLDGWLRSTDEWFVCREKKSFDEAQRIDVVEQIGVASVRSAWDTASDSLKIPAGWGPKLIRHSMASILVNRKVDLVELEMAMGHRALKKTTSRYAIFGPDYLTTIRGGIDDVIADLMKKAGQALHPKLTQADEKIAVLRA